MRYKLQMKLQQLNVIKFALWITENFKVNKKSLFIHIYETENLWINMKAAPKIHIIIFESKLDS